MTTDLMGMLKELDKEYGGFSNVPDGKYMVELGPNTKRVEKAGSENKFRLGWKVTYGEYKGRELGDFVGWFGSDDRTTKITRGVFTQVIRAITSVADDTQRQAVANMVSILRSAATPNATNKAAVIEAIETCFHQLGGLRLTVLAVTGKTGYQNLRYLERGNEPISPPTEYLAEAVTV